MAAHWAAAQASACRASRRTAPRRAPRRVATACGHTSWCARLRRPTSCGPQDVGRRRPVPSGPSPAWHSLRAAGTSSDPSKIRPRCSPSAVQCSERTADQGLLVIQSHQAPASRETRGGSRPFPWHPPPGSPHERAPKKTRAMPAPAQPEPVLRLGLSERSVLVRAGSPKSAQGEDEEENTHIDTIQNMC
eukprot:scaffold587_cov339-Prasinococcus_capsulatus_cf.AAC.3